MASIVQMSGDHRGDYFLLGRRTNVIGRAEALPIQILDDLVSRKHLQIRFDVPTNTYRATDMRSRHGVFVNGHRIKQEVILRDRDMIRLGQTLLLFTLKDLDLNRSALRRFKKAGEAGRPTHTSFNGMSIRPSHTAKADGLTCPSRSPNGIGRSTASTEMLA